MSTLKQLHEQVGKLPMRVRSDGGILTVEYKTSTGDFIATHGKTTHVLFEHENWKLVPEKKKALAYREDDGQLLFCVEGSDRDLELRMSTEYKRVECFNIESGDV